MLNVLPNMFPENTFLDHREMNSRNESQTATCSGYTFSAMFENARMNHVERVIRDRFHPPCQYILAVKEIAADYASILGLYDLFGDHETEDHDYSRKLPFGKEFKDPNIIPFLEDMYVVQTDEGYSVLKTSFGSLKCLLCSSENCRHTDFVNKMMNSTEEYSNALEKMYLELYSFQQKKSYQLKCLSHKKIPFSVTAGAINKKASEIYTEIDGMLQVFPEEMNCSSCGTVNVTAPRQTSYYLSKYDCYPVQEHQSTCIECEAPTFYDGQLDCVFNMDRFLVHHEVLRDFLYHFLHSRATLFSFYTVWAQHQADNGNINFKSLFPYNYFRQTWFLFMCALEIDFKDSFLCDTCGQIPDTLLFDGTSLAFKKDFLP